MGRTKGEDGNQRRLVSGHGRFNKRLHWNGHSSSAWRASPSWVHQHEPYDGRTPGRRFNEDYFTAWCEEHGYPMVDVHAIPPCPSLDQLDARDADVIASYIWLDWRRTSVFLARHQTTNLAFTTARFRCRAAQRASTRCGSTADQAGARPRRGSSPAAGSRGVSTHRARGRAHKMTRLSRTVRLHHRDGLPPLVEHKEAVKDAKSRVYAFRRKTVRARGQAGL